MEADKGTYPRSPKILAKQYRKFFGATVVAVLLLQATLVTDTILVGQMLGSAPMSGVRVASPVLNFLNACAMLVGVGSSTLISVAMGKRRQEDANRLFTLALMLCLIVGILFSAVLVPFAGPITRLISTGKEAIPYTETYLRIVGIASPAYITTSAMAMLLRSDSCVRLSSVVLATAGIANVACDLLFMGALNMGIEGAALATDCGMIAGTLLSLLYFRWPKRTLRITRNLRGTQQGQNPASHIAAIIEGGSASSLRILLSSLALLFLNYIVGASVGVEGIAVLTVCGSLQLLAATFFSAGGQAATPMEGVLYGEGDTHGLRMLVSYVMRIVLALVAVVAVLICMFSAQIYALFVPNGAVEGAERCLRVYALGFAPLAANYVLMYYYSTIGRRGIALVLSVCESFVFYVPLIWLLTNAFGLLGSVSSYVLAEVLTLVTVILAARVVGTRHGCHNLLLLPDESSDLVFEATVPARKDAPARIAHEVKGILDNNDVAPTEALRTSVAIEEMLANAASYGRDKGSDVYFDVRVSARPTNVRVTLRDNGVPFDPTTYETDKDEFEVDGIELLRALATNIAYSYALGMNLTIIDVEKRSES